MQTPVKYHINGVPNENSKFVQVGPFLFITFRTDFVLLKGVMGIIFRYIFRQLFTFSLAVSVSLTLAVLLVRAPRSIWMIANGGLSPTAFLYYVALSMPHILAIVLPVATSCTVLFVYNKLNSDLELIALRACGFSRVRLAKPGITIGLMAMVLVYAINLYFLPASYRELQDLKTHFAQDLAPFILKAGRFRAIGENYTIFFESRDHEGIMNDVLVHDSLDPRREVTFLATTGALARGDDELKAVLWNASRQEVDTETAQMNITYSDRYILALGSIAEKSNKVWRKPQERFLGELLFPDLTNPKDQRNWDSLRAEGHYRLASPLFTLAVASVAVASLLAREFRRRGDPKLLLISVGATGFVIASLFILKELAEGNCLFIPLLYLWPLFLVMASGYALSHSPGDEKQKQVSKRGAA